MKKYLFWILFFESIICYGQTFCYTPQFTEESNRSAFMMRQREKLRDAVIESIFKFRLYIHVIRDSNGTGGQSYQAIQNLINILNTDFNPHGICFVWNGTTEYIDNSYLYSNYDALHQELSEFEPYMNNHINGIDLYLFPDEANFAGGQAFGVGVSAELLIGGTFGSSPSISMVQSHVISHEMGHVLFLWHTHHGTCFEKGDPNQCSELVDGSNSDVCGDYVEDTPADPNLYYNVDPITYQWLGTGWDFNNDPYMPDTRQIMSYTRPQCMDHFSSGQGERMRTAIESVDYLQSALIPFTIIGQNLICGENIYEIEDLPTGCYTIWSWENGSSVPIVQNSPSVNQCTITNNNHAYINDKLVATIYKDNNVVLTLNKTIKTGINFSGTYKQAPHNYGNWNYQGQSATPFYDGDNLYVINGTTITLKSNKFLGANITHSGDTPHHWTRSGDSITFNFQYFQPNTPNLNSITSLNSRQMTIDVVDTMTCEHSRFKIIGQSPLIPLASSQFVQINMQDHSLTFERNRNIGDSENVLSMEDLGFWMLTISNTNTGQIMFQNRTDADKIDVNINDWPAGIYVVAIQIGNYYTSTKFKL